MRITSKLLFLAICLVAEIAVGAETYESFARNSLGVDTTTLQFGKAASANSGFIQTQAPMTGAGLPDAAGLSWMVNSNSILYQNKYPNRTLKYGFRDGKLAAVRISISAFAADGSGGSAREDLIDKRRKELVKIHENFSEARKAEKAASNHSLYNIKYGAMCAPSPESLFVMEMQIELAAEKSR